jgi:hypothetical protein
MNFEIDSNLYASVGVYNTYIPNASPFASFSVIVGPRSARHFALCVDCLLLTTASVGDFPNEYTP